MAETRVCGREGCSKEFQPGKPWQRFCCTAHRVEQWEADHGQKRSGTHRNASLPHRQADEQHPDYETQDEYVLRCLRLRGEVGVHTFELRQRFVGNPSQRIDDLENAGHKIVRGEREQLNGKAYGKRYWLAEFIEKSDDREVA